MENTNYKFIRYITFEAAASAASNIASAGQAIASLFGAGNKGYTPLSKKAQSAYDLYSNKDRENQKKNLEEITKPYYEWQKLNDARLTVAGLRSAGINPLMAYGGLGQALGADSMPAQSSSPDISSLVSASQGAGRLQLDSVDALSRAALNLANTRKSNAETDKTTEDARTQHTFNQFAKDIYKGQRDINFANLNLIDAQTVVERLTGKEKVASIKKLYKECNHIDAQIDQLNAQIKVFNQQRELLLKETDLTSAKVREVESEIALNAARAAREYFGIQVDRAQITSFQASAKLLLEQGSAQALANDFQRFLQGEPGKPMTPHQVEYYQKRRAAVLSGFDFTVDESAEHGFHVGFTLGDTNRVNRYVGRDNSPFAAFSRFFGATKFVVDSAFPSLLKLGKGK